MVWSLIVSLVVSTSVTHLWIQYNSIGKWIDLACHNRRYVFRVWVCNRNDLHDSLLQTCLHRSCDLLLFYSANISIICVPQERAVNSPSCVRGIASVTSTLHVSQQTSSSPELLAPRFPNRFMTAVPAPVLRHLFSKNWTPIPPLTLVLGPDVEFSCRDNWDARVSINCVNSGASTYGNVRCRTLCVAGRTLGKYRWKNMVCRTDVTRALSVFGSLKMEIEYSGGGGGGDCVEMDVRRWSIASQPLEPISMLLKLFVLYDLCVASSMYSEGNGLVLRSATSGCCQSHIVGSKHFRCVWERGSQVDVLL